MENNLSNQLPKVKGNPLAPGLDRGGTFRDGLYTLYLTSEIAELEMPIRHPALVVCRTAESELEKP